MVLGACTDPHSSTFFAGTELGTAAPKGAGIYYWKTSWEMSAAEQETLAGAGVEQLFLRLFDVDWNFNEGKPEPRGVLRLPDSLALDASLLITPVVFIVERVFRQDVDVEELAGQISRTISGMLANQPALSKVYRWQIDCDWTPVSRNRYFAFLKALKEQNPGLTLNVTVRLHQYREREQNGVPPVPEGLLMCYNMEPVQDPGTTNAIYREDLLRGYLKAPPYPIPLDAGLPIFEWGAAFRDERFLGIVDLPASLPGALKEIAPDRFLVMRDTSLGDTFLRAGDDIRHHGAGNTGALKTAAKLLKQKPEIRDLLFFDWRADQEQKFNLSEIRKEFYR